VTGCQATAVSLGNSSSHHERSFDFRSRILSHSSRGTAAHCRASGYRWRHAPAWRGHLDEA